MNKNINKIKVAITTSCNLGCSYCFVNRTGEAMNLISAKRSVDLLLSSPGQDKLFSMYGGEPLLNFKLIKDICPYALLEARKLNKNLTVSICTNGTLLTREHLSFFRKFGVKLIISMVGDRFSHNRFRKFKNACNSYEIIAKKIPLVLKGIPAKNLGVSFCMFPSLADSIENDFHHLLKLGFRYFNFEIIREYEKWTQDKINKFALKFAKITEYVFSEISKKNFIFLNPVNWEIKYRLLTKSLEGSCPFGYNLEVYPDGSMAFSPFLLNSVKKDNYIIGNINMGFVRFNNCRFSLNNEKCLRCEGDYHKGYAFDERASIVQRLYHFMCLETARRIKKNAPRVRAFSDYIKKIKEKVCF